MAQRSPRLKAGAVLAALAVLTALAAMVHEVTQSDQAPPQVKEVTVLSSGLGVYAGSGRPANVDAYEGWLGGPVPWVLDFIAGDTWAAIDNPAWWLDQWKGKGREVVFSVPMLPSTSYTLAAGAQGQYNSHWRRLAEKLVAAGEGNKVLRIGWEFNGEFQPWAAGGQEAAFVAYWRQIVTTMRTVTGADFRFDWTPLMGATAADVERAYPGDAYVDIIGLDAYDQSASRANLSPAALWQDTVDRKYGLRWHRDFAAAHDKPVSFPEWGLSVSPLKVPTHEDNPHYIRSMRTWFAGSDLVYAAYFEADARDWHHKLSDGQFPKSAPVFVELFANGLPTGGEPTTTTTASLTTTTAPAPTATPPPTTTTTGPLHRRRTAPNSA